jgi:hypothetical protein
MTHSTEMSLNWLGASTNSFRILLASSIAVMKSPTLKPKLIVVLSTVPLLPYKKRSGGILKVDLVRCRLSPTVIASGSKALTGLLARLSLLTVTINLNAGSDYCARTLLCLKRERI